MQLGFHSLGSSTGTSNLMQLPQGLSSLLSNSSAGSDPSTTHTYHQVLTDLEVYQKLQQRLDDAAAVAVSLLSLKRALKNSKAPNAACMLPEHSLNSSVKPHTNAECQKQQRQRQQQQQQQHQQQLPPLQQAQLMLQQLGLQAPQTQAMAHPVCAAYHAVSLPAGPSWSCVDTELLILSHYWRSTRHGTVQVCANASAPLQQYCMPPRRTVGAKANP
jgi:hypothetical protein